ncbi:hypothetical protein NL676_011122 [Syzygium grande]|nr:hypothetical protein NL676_011122 [Syzygium grande]
MATTKSPWMGLYNGHHLGQHAQTHFITRAHGYKKENSSCNGKSKKGKYKKKEKIIFKKKSKECKSGGSSSSSDSESESDNDRF